ncbi:TLC domain-containing protein [Lipomyces arxii]|uniref:TLC domain-containing protein n=1 Tax=Lipomyces arxii TaxID=56418 RepID=UPI0034CD35A1
MEAKPGSLPITPSGSGSGTPVLIASGASQGTRSRRTSSIGQFTLGDNATPSLSTMTPTETQIRGSQKRQRALSRSDSSFNGVGSPPISTSNADELPGGLQRLWFMYRETAYRKTWVTPLVCSVIPIVIFAAMTDHSPKNFLYPFLFVSYPIEPKEPGAPVMYGKGRNDFCFVFYYMIVFGFLREFAMQQILEPIARWCGLSKPGKIKRFMEQAYTILYEGVMAPWGLYIMHHMPLWYFETRPMYENYPHKMHELDFKLYYLLQASFWVQQSVVLSLQMEKPRKDFRELVFHHIVTIALIFCSYRFHFTWIGIEIYITMDASDIALAMSKILNYLDHWLTGPFFFLFMCTWIYLRHYLNLRILWSVATEFRTVGDFTLNWETEQYKCWISQYITFALLLGLQLVNLYWLVLIFRIAYRFIFFDIAKDERSDDDEEEEAAMVEEEKCVKKNLDQTLNVPSSVLNGGKMIDEPKKTI